MSPLPAAPARRRTTTIWLVLVLAAGLAMRLWYLGYDPGPNRFWDERFSFDNVRQLLESGSLEPANGYYPLLSYLPQTLALRASAALERATGDPGLAIYDGGRFTAHAYLLSRGVQALWGVATIWLTFLVGRRLFSDPVGLVAATAVAFSPGLIHASAVFKPDAPLVLAVLLTFWWSLAAVRRPTAGRYAVAGGGVALAMSTKLTGGLAALPLILVTALRCRREPRRLLWLTLAGAAALILFVLLNPYWPAYFEYLDKLTAEYEWKAHAQQMTRWQAPLLIVGSLRRSLGAIALVAAAAATGALAVLIARRRLDPESATGTALLLLFPPAYTAAYVAKTAQFKPNNFLPIVPFVALAAAWGLVEAGRLLARRWRPVGAGSIWLAAGATIVALVLVPPAVLFVHRSTTPTAEDLALSFVDRRMHGHPACRLLYEPGPHRWPAWEQASFPRACLLVPVDRLDAVETADAWLTDGVLFPSARLTGATAFRYFDAVAASDEGQTAVFGRLGLRVRGPGYAAALYSWALAAPQQPLDLRLRDEGQFRLTAEMPPEVKAGDVVSFVVWMPRWALAEGAAAPRLRMGGQVVELTPAHSDPAGTTLLSPRLISRQPAPNARLDRRRLMSEGETIRLTLLRWSRYGAAAQSGAARSETILQLPASSTSSSTLSTSSE